MTIFDIITVICFVAVVAAYFTIGQPDPKLLPHYLLSCVAFAFANQFGNGGHIFIGVAVLLAGVTYAVVTALRAVKSNSSGS